MKTGFDFTAMTEREKYRILIGAVVPRPIALVTTVDRAGRVNAAPFSFFNCLSAEPAILALGVENHDDLSFKDTARNIRDTGVFTVNVVSDAILEAMNVCAVPFAPGVDELAEAGLTAIPGERIAAPHIGESPASFECRSYLTLGIGNSREIILGEVVAAHVRADAIDERLRIDPERLDAIGRMGGHGYCRTRGTFDLPTMTVPEWAERKAGRKAGRL